MKGPRDCDLVEVVEVDELEQRFSRKSSLNNIGSSDSYRTKEHSSELVLNPHTSPFDSYTLSDCVVTTPKDDKTIKVLTPSDRRSNTSLSESTDESFLSSEDDRHFGRDSLRGSTSRSDVVAVSNLRSSSRSAGRLEVGCSVQEVSSPGCYGEVTVENSSEVHFGNKIYTAPITVVNHLAYPDDAKLVEDDKNVCSDPFERPTGLHWPRMESLSSRWASRRMAVAITIIVIITVCSALATVLIVLGNSSGAVTDDILIDASWFYTRDEWQAKHWKRVTPLNNPVPYVIILHTATITCTTHHECVNVLGKIQDGHMFEDHSWDDIAYNYMIGGGVEGGVYVGRGANAVGAHAGSYNPVSLGIAFVGNYNEIAPSPGQMEHVAELIQEAVRMGKLKDNYQVRAHCQVSPTTSPGKFLMEEVRKMLNWDSSTDCSL